MWFLKSQSSAKKNFMIKERDNNLYHIMTTTRRKPKRMPDNLLMLMEWLRLGNKFYIHKEFLLYLDIEDIARICLTSKHYCFKYLKFSCFHYIGTKNILIQDLNILYVTQYAKLTMLDLITKTVFYCSKDKKAAKTIGKMFSHNKKLQNIIAVILKRNGAMYL